MSERLLTYRGTVHAWHCDHMGHMNVMWHVGKFDEATWQLFSAIGITAEFMRNNNRGMAGVEQRISYKKELFPGDTISIFSRVLELKEKAIHIEHEMIHDPSGIVAATMVVIGVHIDTTRRKAIAFPQEVKANAKAFGI